MSVVEGNNDGEREGERENGAVTRVFFFVCVWQGMVWYGGNISSSSSYSPLIVLRLWADSKSITDRSKNKSVN